MGRGSISIHPKYGVNPSMGACFICGEDTGEILLLGNNRGQEAPRKMISGSMCPQCKQAVAAGAVMLVEVKDGEAGKKEPYRTGRIVGVSRSAINESAIGKSPMAYVEESDLKAMMGDMYEKKFNNLKEGE